MGILGRLFSTKNTVSVGRFLTGGFARWMDRDIKIFADEGYRRNVIAFRCVEIISKSFGSVGLKVQINGEDAPDHPLKLLLENPNPVTAGAEFFDAVCSYNRLAGNSYMEAIRDGTGKPKELYLWSPYEMQITPSDSDAVPWAASYTWATGSYKKTWPIDPRTGQSDMAQWKTFNPLDAEFGMSPMEPAAYSVDQHNAAGEWNQALLQNSASPDGMLTTDGNLSDAQYENLRKEIEKNMSGPRNARRPFIGEGGLKWTQLSMNPKDMDWLAGRKASAIDIAAAYGVPVQLLGIEGSQTFANFEQARLSLWEDTVLPLLDQAIDLLNNWLVPMYEEKGLAIIYDMNSIEALEFKRTKAMESVNNLGYLTINEKRTMAGFERVDDPAADEITMPAGQLPLGFDVENMDGNAAKEAAVKQLKSMGISEDIARLMI